jgi:hypothetical protein
MPRTTFGRLDMTTPKNIIYFLVALWWHFCTGNPAIACDALQDCK